MSEPFDRELELIKIQIAADACLAGVQIYLPLGFGGMIALSVLAYSVMLQYPSTYPGAQVLTILVIILVVVLAIIVLLARREYEGGIRDLDAYEKDFRAGKPLPAITKLCGVKVKKRRLAEWIRRISDC